MKPLQAPADFVSVNGLLGQLQSAQMTALKDRPDDLKDLKQYGLDKPQVVATIGMGASPSSSSSAPRPTLPLSGRVTPRRPPSSASTTASPQSSRRRSTICAGRKCSSSGRYNTTRFEITRGNATRAFERVKGTGENAVDTWKQVRPARKSRRLEQLRGRAARLVEPSRRELRGAIRDRPPATTHRQRSSW